MSWTKATWRKGRQRISGSWSYSWSLDTFYIRLDSKDPVTGQTRTVELKGYDHPEWNGWKLVEAKAKKGGT